MSELASRKLFRIRSLPIVLTSIAAVAFVVYALASDRLIYAVIASLIPLMILILVESFARKQFAFLMLLIVNYFIPVIPHYVYDFPAGTLMDIGR